MDAREAREETTRNLKRWEETNKNLKISYLEAQIAQAIKEGRYSSPISSVLEDWEIKHFETLGYKVENAKETFFIPYNGNNQVLTYNPYGGQVPLTQVSTIPGTISWKE